MDQTSLTKTSPLFVPRLLWAAFLLSIIQYDIVAYLSASGPGRRVATEDAPMVLFGVMALCYVFYFLIPRFFPSDDTAMGTESTKRAKDFLRLLLQMAAASAAPMMGLLIAFSDGVLRPLWISSVFSFLLIAVLFPRGTSSL